MGKISESEKGTNDCERVVWITYFAILLTPFFQILWNRNVVTKLAENKSKFESMQPRNIVKFVLVKNIEWSSPSWLSCEKNAIKAITLAINH